MPARRPLTTEEQADADRLHALVRNDGRSQMTVALACGWTTQGAVSQYIRGVIPLNLTAATKFARALNVDLHAISPRLAAAAKAAAATTGTGPKYEDGSGGGEGAADADELLAELSRRMQLEPDLRPLIELLLDQRSTEIPDSIRPSLSNLIRAVRGTLNSALGK